MEKQRPNQPPQLLPSSCTTEQTQRKTCCHACSVTQENETAATFTSSALGSSISHFPFKVSTSIILFFDEQCLPRQCFHWGIHSGTAAAGTTRAKTRKHCKWKTCSSFLQKECCDPHLLSRGHVPLPNSIQGFLFCFPNRIILKMRRGSDLFSLLSPQILFITIS